VSNESAWTTVSATSGTGSGRVTLTASANTTNTIRTAILTIAGRPFSLTQYGTAPGQTKPKRPGKPRVVIGG